VPIILERGAEWWKEQGVKGATGLKFFAVSGHVERPDVYCVRAGATARDLIELAGGVTGGREVGAIQPGGASSNFLGPAQLEETLRKTSICGLGQVALGPVLSVTGVDRGGAAAREHPKDPEDTET